MAMTGTTGTTPATKGEQTRRAILRAAITRFGRDGFRATSVADIARDAGVGGTVAYAYYPNKEALFLAAAARWNLRVGWTWFAMTYTYGLTIVIANAADVAGLPALPFLSAAFLAANADLLWAAIRRSEDSSSSSPSSSGDDPAPS